MLTSLAGRTPSTDIREARRQLCQAGEVAQGLISPALRRSWERSRQFGLVTRSNIVGVVKWIYSPAGSWERFGTVE